MSQNLTYKELAKILAVEVTTVRRLIERHGAELGIVVQRGRSNTSNAKWTHFLSREDADRLTAFYESRGNKVESAAPDDPTQRAGRFYVIQLVPEALPNRVKIGYTDNMEKRLAEHQTAAPTARLIASWPCKRSWDYAAMDSITRSGCSWVLNEVWEGDPQGFVERGKAFFDTMPALDAERVLSSHSPMNQPPGDDDEAPERPGTSLTKRPGTWLTLFT